MQIIKKIEHERITIEDVKDKRFFKKLEEFAQSTKLIDYSNKGELKANQFVGVIHTKYGILEIYPKITQNNDYKKAKKIFLKMLKTLKDSAFEKLDDSKIDKLKNFPLLEVFISLFLDEVEEIIKKGIKHHYVTKEENQTFLKGKLKIQKHLKYNLIHKERFFVEYDEYLPNILENRILKTTLLKLSKISTQKQKIKKLLFVFDEIKPLHNLALIKNLTLNRLTNYYEKAINLSKLFLFGNSLVPYSGKEDVFALLFDMNKLFESYVGEFFRSNNKNIKLQDKSHYLFESPQFKQLKPDIIIDNKIIIDTKWKIIENKNISESDLYQMFVYAAKYGINNVYLMYPKNSNAKPKTLIANICNSKFKFKIVFFDLKK